MILCRVRYLAFSLLALLLVLPCAVSQAQQPLKQKKVLVVLSYHQGYPWHEETVEGIESVLGDAQLTYFYLDTKRNLAGGRQKAQEALQLYRSLQPDAVIVADDNAQKLFAVPYLKGKVETPVTFCGVNDDATKYGYPADNLTGIVEKKHYRESLSLLQLIAPQVQRLAVLYRETPSNRLNIAQLKKEKGSYPAELVEFVKIATERELEGRLKQLQNRVDALLVLNLAGLPTVAGGSLKGREAIAEVNRYWQKPTFGASTWEVEAGTLCAVAKKGQEQGRVAAQMALRMMEGMPASELPVQQNRNGLRVINLATATRLGLKLKPIALIGAELVK